MYSRPKKPNYIVPFFFLLMLVGLVVPACITSHRFEVGCEGHLKRAADANTVELALVELDTAIQYAEAHNLTSGTTAVVLPKPDEDLGFWYRNLVASRDELRNLGPSETPLTKTNTLIKLRETLLDDSGSGVSVTVPPGISRYPNNAVFCGYFWIALIGFLASSIVALIRIDN